MPLPDAPRARISHRLDIVGPLPEGTSALFVTVSFGRSSERVHGRVDAATPDGEYLLGTLRCGVRTWRSLLLPAIRVLARAQRIKCTVREVESGPPHTERIIPTDTTET